MFKKMSHGLMALTMGLGAVVVSVPQAQADHGRGVAVGLAAGIIGLGILGAAANARGRNYYYADEGRECYRGPRECHWSGRRCFENRWGDTVCRGGNYVCERPLVCE